ncbi:MAG TPA: hypothetical protein VMU48_02450 [Terracidiphilus sp.]|nr:hypothetical protein [Terracidiphilus sp.]
MKFFLARTLAPALIATVVAAICCQAQNAPSGTTAPTQNSGSSGKVIFSRSMDANGQVTTQVGPASAQPKIELAAKPSVEDAARRAITYTALDLDVRLYTAAHQIAVRGQVTVRNDGKTPLQRVPLQISSSLNWEQIRTEGKNVDFTVATLNSDADHTGQLHEAAVSLAEPLAPGAETTLDVTYSGTIAPNAQRLLAVGTPQDLAIRSDWDEISVPFTGLRGFGNVVWYPVSSVPAVLGDGARLFDEIGRHKLHLTGARFRLRLTVEFPHGEPPTVALINGHPAALAVKDQGGLDPGVTGTATASLDNSILGFEAPSIFVAVRKEHTTANLTAWTLPEDEVAVQAWTGAATAVTPFLESWLGPHPRSQLTLLDLPDPQDAPYATGALLVASLHESSAEQLQGILVHGMAQAYLQPATQPPPAWLSEGVSTFLESVWVEKSQGRERALGALEADRSALALAEPSSPGESSGQPLAVATSPVYYRAKAAYVLWMLRELAGDQALSAALRGYISSPIAKTNPEPQVASLSLQNLLKKAGVTRDLSWFFSDWVDADKGLPDLSIVSVFPNAAQGGTYLVAVNVANSGYAAAEVPVTVRTAQNEVTEQVLVPARGSVVRRLLVTGSPTQVQVNDGTVPETEASEHITDINAGASSAANSSAPSGP